MEEILMGYSCKNGRETVLGEHKTAVYHNDGFQVVRYWETEIVRFNYDEIQLNTGGYKTKMTKLRMEQASTQFNLEYHIENIKGKWHAVFRGEAIPFNGNTLTLKRR